MASDMYGCNSVIGADRNTPICSKCKLEDGNTASHTENNILKEIRHGT